MDTKTDTENKDLYGSPLFCRSRAAYFSQCAFAYCGTILLSSGYIAKLLTAMDFPDALTGIVSSLLTFSNMAMIFSIGLINRTKNLRRTVLLCSGTNMVLFLLAYLIPFLQVSRSVRVLLVFVSVGGGYAVKSICSPIYERLISFFVDPSGRSLFHSTNNIISLIAAAVLSLWTGFVVDRYAENGDMNGCFRFLAILMACFTVLDVASLLLMGEPSAKQTQDQHKSLRQVMKLTFAGRGFRSLLLMRGLYAVSIGCTSGFVGTFFLNDLHFRFSTVQIFTNIGSLLWICSTRPICRLADRSSYARGYRIGMSIAALSYVCLLFAGKTAPWLAVAYLLLYRCSNAGTGPTGSAILFNYVPADCFAQATAIYGVFYGLINFLSALAAGKLLELVQQNGNMLFGFSVYGQNVLAAAGLFFSIAAVLYSRFVLEKIPVLRG